VVGWLTLGSVAAIVKGGFHPVPALLRIVGLACYAAMLLIGGKIVCTRLVRRELGERSAFGSVDLGLILVTLFASAAVSSALGAHAALGGFLAGLSCLIAPGVATAWRERVQRLVAAMLLPVCLV